MRVELTDEQIQLIQPLLTDVANAAALGLHGMLVAQIGTYGGGRPCMTVGFIRNAQAKVLERQASEQLPTGGSRA